MIDVTLPTAVTSVLDATLDFIYGLEPLVAPTVCLGKQQPQNNNERLPTIDGRPAVLIMVGAYGLT